jgi:hypothetical protein
MDVSGLIGGKPSCMPLGLQYPEIHSLIMLYHWCATGEDVYFFLPHAHISNLLQTVSIFSDCILSFICPVASYLAYVMLSYAIIPTRPSCTPVASVLRHTGQSLLQ